MDKFLIVGLGNPGPEYHETRHNVGWMVIDAFAKSQDAVFEDKRFGFLAQTSVRGRKLFLLKPTTFMNLSGNAVRYWLEKENIPNSHLLVIVDDKDLPQGKFRLRGKGSGGSHNGLGHIQQLIGQDYARLRIGIGRPPQRGDVTNWVLGRPFGEDRERWEQALDAGLAVLEAFAARGLEHAVRTAGEATKRILPPA